MRKKTSNLKNGGKNIPHNENSMCKDPEERDSGIFQALKEYHYGGNGINEIERYEMRLMR